MNLLFRLIDAYVSFIQNDNRRLMYGTALIISLGLLLQSTDTHPFENWFARSGALLVCFSITCVYINHFIAQKIKQSQSQIDALKKAPTDPVEFFKTANWVTKNDSPENIGKNIASAITVTQRLPGIIKNDEKDLESTKTLSQSIVVYEFMTAVMGTLIWGFGDFTIVIWTGYICLFIFTLLHCLPCTAVHFRGTSSS